MKQTIALLIIVFVNSCYTQNSEKKFLCEPHKIFEERASNILEDLLDDRFEIPKEELILYGDYQTPAVNIYLKKPNISDEELISINNLIRETLGKKAKRHVNVLFRLKHELVAIVKSTSIDDYELIKMDTLKKQFNEKLDLCYDMINDPQKNSIIASHEIIATYWQITSFLEGYVFLIVSKDTFGKYHKSYFTTDKFLFADKGLKYFGEVELNPTEMIYYTSDGMVQEVEGIAKTVQTFRVTANKDLAMRNERIENQNNQNSHFSYHYFVRLYNQ